MALSSVAGIFCDLIFPHLFQPSSWKKQLILTIMLAVFFPFFTYLGEKWQVVAFFALAGIIWGIYYELYFFAQQNFVVLQVPRAEYSRFWSLISVCATLAFTIGPIVAAQLILQPFSIFSYYIFFQGLALLIIYFLSVVKTPPHPEAKSDASLLTFFQEMKSWRILLPRIYPAVIVGVLIKSIDAAFWTIGALYGYHLFTTQIVIGGIVLDQSYSWLPLILYQVPLFFASLLLMKLGIQHRKKRLSEMLLVVSGLFLSGLMLTTNVLLILPLIFLSGLALALAFPLNQAVYSDLIKRAQGFEEDVVGLAQANTSIAYIIAPLVAGYLADRVGYGMAFGLLGFFTMIVTLILLLVTPRKLHLPQAEMQTL